MHECKLSKNSHRLRNNNLWCSHLAENNLRSKRVSALKMATLPPRQNNLKIIQMVAGLRRVCTFYVRTIKCRTFFGAHAGRVHPTGIGGFCVGCVFFCALMGVGRFSVRTTGVHTLRDDFVLCNLLPINQPQPRYPCKFSSVVCHQNRIISASSGGN